jgi:hypothetical protein
MYRSILLQDATVSRDQLREQIRQTVRQATEAAAARAAQAADRAGTQPGALAVPPPPGTPVIAVNPFPFDDIPPRVENIAISFFIMLAVIAIGLPLMRAIARRIERGTPVAPPLPREVSDQLQRISQSVDAIAIEVERISEGQRFTTKMLAERTPGTTE